MADFCLRCGRALKNKNSIKRGYGPGCYKKIKSKKVGENKVEIDNQERIEVKGQIDILDELKQRKIS